jgi:hypothetical protein
MAGYDQAGRISGKSVSGSGDSQFKILVPFIYKNDKKYTDIPVPVVKIKFFASFSCPGSGTSTLITTKFYLHTCVKQVAIGSTGMVPEGCLH